MVSVGGWDVPPELGVTMALSVLGAGLLAGVHHNLQLIMRSNQIGQAENIAEAGAEEAVWEIQYGGADFAAIDGWSGSGPGTVSRQGNPAVRGHAATT